MGRPVVLLDDKWNTIVPSQIKEVYEGACILHFWHSVSFLYSNRVMQYVKNNGLTDFIKYYILHPTETFLPPNNRVNRYKLADYLRFQKIVVRTIKSYVKNVDISIADMVPSMHGANLIRWFIRHKFYHLASIIVVLVKLYDVKMSSKNVDYENYYANI